MTHGDTLSLLTVHPERVVSRYAYMYSIYKQAKLALPLYYLICLSSVLCEVHQALYAGED